MAGRDTPPAASLEQRDIDAPAERTRVLLRPDAYGAAEYAVLTQPQDRQARQAPTLRR
jgi:hypothetical protein